MQYAVIRGEYPFDEVVNMVEAPADRPDLALETAKLLFLGNKDVALRHPVVEPVNSFTKVQ